jgi:pimeloyl-ACP methyl ester carboxylesterase
MTVTTQDRFITGSVTSKDGTTIGYRQLGQGPGLLLVHGAMESAQNHMQLAEALADAFTVYLLDRRGRGLSGAYGKEYSVQEDVDDLDALLSSTDTHNVFGVSSGAIICLQAALNLPIIQRVAIYEPPLSMTRAAANAILTRYDEQMAQGKVSAALVTGMKGAQMGPAIFNMMPNWLLEILTNQMMAGSDKRANGHSISEGDAVSFRALAPTLHYDFQLVSEMSESLDRFSSMPVPVLLLGGSKSPAYLKTSLDMLEKILPDAGRVEFPGLNHGGSGNTDFGGQPKQVAQELRSFFA